MIERKRVKCPNYRPERLGHENAKCMLSWRCREECTGDWHIVESDTDYIARLNEIIARQQKHIAKYKWLTKRWKSVAKWLAYIDGRIGCYACVARYCNCGLDMTRSSIKGCKAARLAAAKKATEGGEG